MSGADPELAAGLAFLGELERAESELLSWGIVEGSFSRQELVARAMDYIDRRVDEGHNPGFTSADALLGWLDEHRLLWPVYDEEDRYRTRMAEALRLIANLRQMFPRMARGQTRPQAEWRTAKSLVADFRLLLAPRRFPKRRIESAEVCDAIGRLREPTSRHRDVIHALLRADSDDPRKLAKFQLDATVAILGRLRPARRASGTIVCAGTGSGKTLAFYLPAFIAIADWLGDRPWTKCLAVYPRNELLKDQLREALGQAKRVNGALKAGRTLSIGVLYGDVPHQAKQLLGDATQRGKYLEAWEPVGKDALRCPLADCPACNRRLLWRRGDIQNEIERLVCDGCGLTWGPTEVRLTRKAMLANPPDVLFTSTEMLNQRMATDLGPLFGVGMPEAYRPRLVLLDEVHTYEGVHGAQVALLLRRWQRLAAAQPHFVGLSATLVDAARFFAEVVGALPGNVTEIGPDEGELDVEGMEYLLALRGDPVSGASLLSTSIQTIMLLRRVLEPRAAKSPALGRKVFSFTDNLDVNNRLYFDLLDAEGWRRPGVPDTRKPWGSLAVLRSPDLPEHAPRLAHGQSWDLVEWAGHSLAAGTRVPVGRVSSLDRGIDRGAEMVVATSSLEVGFDDPDVGAVVQHKAPRSAAAFLQRKGRAGRRREMRPWTVVVLSDFGRDRVAYQAYEQLFSPVLSPRHLPVGNRHVLKIQAAYALVEWVAVQLASQGHGRFDLWSELSGPPDARGGPYAQTARRRQGAVAQLLLGVLEGGAPRASLVEYLRSALRLDDGALDGVLWEAPRALLTAVVPTWLRRLERAWERSGSRRSSALAREPHVPRSPLPEFAPRALFSDLNLPEVEVVLRNAFRERVEWMPIAQMLREFAPGRVSHRYSIQHVEQRNWIPVGEGEAVVLLESFCDEAHLKELGEFIMPGPDGVDERVAAVRPFRVIAEEPPSDVDSSSNAFPRWSTTLVPTTDGLRLDLPRGSRWCDILEGVRVHLHALGSPVEITRVTPGADTVVKVGGAGTETFVRFARRKPDGGGIEPVALGFTADVDAIAFDLRLPTALAAIGAADPRLLRALRPAYFRHRVQTDARLDGRANRFQRDWLADAYLSALAVRAAESGTSLEDAARQLRPPDSGDTLRAVLDTLFMALPATEEESPTDELERGKRHEEILELLNDPSITQVLDESASALWGTPDDTWEPWLWARLEATLGAVLIEAIQALCAQTAAGDLLLESGLQSPSSSLWLTETSLGGAGVVEEFVSRYGEDPRRFFDLLDGLLGRSNLEEIDAQIRALLAWVEAGSPRRDARVVAAVEAMRDARDHQHLVESSATFRRLLAERGAVVSQPVVAALFARVLRPGSTPESDTLLARIVDTWDALEERFAIEIEPRCVALLESRGDALDQALKLTDAAVAPSERRAWRFATLLGLLWLRGSSARSESLKASSPFAALPTTEKLLLSVMLRAPSVDVPIENDDWFATFTRVLVEHGSAGISCSIAEPARLRSALLRVLVEPVDADVLLVHARHQGIRRDADRIVAVFDIPEAIQ